MLKLKVEEEALDVYEDGNLLFEVIPYEKDRGTKQILGVKREDVVAQVGFGKGSFDKYQLHTTKTDDHLGVILDSEGTPIVNVVSKEHEVVVMAFLKQFEDVLRFKK